MVDIVPGSSCPSVAPPIENPGAGAQIPHILGSLSKEGGASDASRISRLNFYRMHCGQDFL